MLFCSASIVEYRPDPLRESITFYVLAVNAMTAFELSRAMAIMSKPRYVGAGHYFQPLHLTVGPSDQPRT